MNIARQIAGVETANRAREFTSYAKFLMLGKGSGLDAYAIASERRALPPVLEVLKSAQTAGTTTDTNWASSLAPYKSISDGFLASLAEFSAFDRILSDTHSNRFHCTAA
jgi:hypothetical protein